MALQRSIAVDQGAEYSNNIAVLDANGDIRDLTGYTANAQFRKFYDSNASISFTTLVTNGNILISLSHTQTQNVAPGRYVYDVTLTSNTGAISRVVEGVLTLNPQVTR